jgi:DNA-binding transcriptional regulator YiaG
MQHTEIRTIRDDLGWSQQELARYLGVDQASVSRMEKGQPLSGPVVKLLEQLQAKTTRKRA